MQGTRGVCALRALVEPHEMGGFKALPDLIPCTLLNGSASCMHISSPSSENTFTKGPSPVQVGGKGYVFHNIYLQIIARTLIPEIRIRHRWKEQNSRAVTGRRQRLSDTAHRPLSICISMIFPGTRGLTTPIECLGRGSHLRSRKSYKVE